MGTLDELETRLGMLETVLGVEPGLCSGDPTECQGCVREPCMLQDNRLTELGSLVVALLDEFRWHRAWAEELESQRVVSEGTATRVELRVQREKLRERLREVTRTLSGVCVVQVLGVSIQDRLTRLRDAIQRLDDQLGDAS